MVQKTLETKAGIFMNLLKIFHIYGMQVVCTRINLVFNLHKLIEAHLIYFTVSPHNHVCFYHNIKQCNKGH